MKQYESQAAALMQRGHVEHQRMLFKRALRVRAIAYGGMLIALYVMLHIQLS